ncbi:Type 1 glutamine amidotransferase-like domain-containing protein [Cytobacillus purgationiresistens]|uniref:Cyanophycinase n=1 Tax=Cytobacillus purgationiresistens TaxID=863449 RepID=A0ABU0AQU6_9BACI|nr:Type 1 glutamine amidotransferase-like domain-containing protein [Cytobacillus purgationiresistens]MDQ0272778.1 cyanophycinase [Cytobacillus purgationiresistens]
MDQHLFLFGGSLPFGEEFGKTYAELSSRSEGSVVILCLDREGWESYMPIYRNILESNGIEHFSYVLLSHRPSPSDLKLLSDCSGIIICGGNTERYRAYIVDTPIGEVIKERYKEGIPVAGFSAGALITPEHCVISPRDNEQEEQLFLQGLGFIKGCVLSAHFTKWDEEENIKKAMDLTGTSIGYGLDDEASIYFKNGQLASIEGEGIHYFKMIV